MKRRNAREKILQILFQIDMTKNSADEAITNILEDEEVEQNDLEFIKERVHGTNQHVQELDNELMKYLNEWKINRLANIDRSILRLAAYELMYINDVSISIILNEAIELAKRFGSDESPKFINGVLGAFVKKSEKIAERMESKI